MEQIVGEQEQNGAKLPHTLLINTVHALVFIYIIMIFY